MNMTAEILSNTAPLVLADDGTTEVLRRYEVTIHKPGLLDDDGVTEIAYTVQVTLRYDQKRAGRRLSGSYLALEEAARRAVKLERRMFHTPDSQSMFVDAATDVRFVGEKLVPARAAR